MGKRMTLIRTDHHPSGMKITEFVHTQPTFVDIQIGDVIISIDGESVLNKTEDEQREMWRGMQKKNESRATEQLTRDTIEYCRKWGFSTGVQLEVMRKRSLKENAGTRRRRTSTALARMDKAQYSQVPSVAPVSGKPQGTIKVVHINVEKFNRSEPKWLF